MGLVKYKGCVIVGYTLKAMQKIELLNWKPVQRKDKMLSTKMNLFLVAFVGLCFTQNEVPGKSNYHCNYTKQNKSQSIWNPA